MTICIYLIDHDLLLHVTINSFQRVVAAILKDSGWEVEFTVLPVGAIAVSVDFLNKEVMDKCGPTWKSYDEAFHRAVVAHSVAALQLSILSTEALPDIWVYRCKTVQALEDSRPTPD